MLRSARALQRAERKRLDLGQCQCHVCHAVPFATG
jgi:hypothetical protein